ncbi:hypothetical protein [Roseibium aggregatum]|uniref:Fibronectin-binding protein n=1 Tax=Roseibium aggregatum TaxID=187304 RepID=A0A939EJK0_9HYPH|nr:hypothetical protein [Roseibium aggregatum]MBN9672849.1 hypothetical protein [Roseibium aggregatum]
MVDRIGGYRLKAVARLLVLGLFAGTLAVPAAVSVSVPAAAAPKPSFQPEIAGVYVVQGLNPDGTHYQGRVTIEVKGGTAFFRWDIAGQVYHGQGPLAGKTLIIDWGQNDPVIYEIHPDGTLTGTWAAGRASETLNRLK